MSREHGLTFAATDGERMAIGDLECSFTLPMASGSAAGDAALKVATIAIDPRAGFIR